MFASLRTRLRAARDARIERAALRRLLVADNHLLTDIGLSRHDVMQMIDGPDLGRR